MIKNCKIKDAGLVFNAHFNVYYIQVELDFGGGGACITFPVDHAREFVSMFDDELDFEDGAYLHQLKGHPAVVQTDNNGKIIAIGSFLMKQNELMPIKGVL